MCIILIVKGLNSQEALKWTGQDLSNSVLKTESCTVCRSTNKKHQTNEIVWEWGETKHKEPSKLSMRIILGMNGDLLVSVLYWPGKICDLPKKKIHPDKSSCDSFTWSFTLSCLILNLFLVGCCHLWEVNVKLKFWLLPSVSVFSSFDFAWEENFRHLAYWKYILCKLEQCFLSKT